MSFGSSFAYYYLETFWFVSSLKSRIVRGIIVATFYILIYTIFSLITFETVFSKIVFNLLLSIILVNYCSFGLVPLLCKKLGLVNLQKISSSEIVVNNSFLQ